MIALDIICVLIMLIWIGSIGPFLGCVVSGDIDDLGNMFNPVVMYNNGAFNIFGVVFLSIISTVALLPGSIIYWFYKLCTVGRR